MAPVTLDLPVNGFLIQDIDKNHKKKSRKDSCAGADGSSGGSIGRPHAGILPDGKGNQDIGHSHADPCIHKLFNDLGDRGLHHGLMGLEVAS